VKGVKGISDFGIRSEKPELRPPERAEDSEYCTGKSIENLNKSLKSRR